MIKNSYDSENGSLWKRIEGVFGPKMRLALAVGIIVGVVQQITASMLFSFMPQLFLSRAA